MPQVEIGDLPGSRITYFWSIYNGELAILPKVGSGNTILLVGHTMPAAYVDADMGKDLVNIVSDSDTQVQKVDERILEIIRYAVAEKMSEQLRDFDAADRYRSRKLELKHEMSKHFENENEFVEEEGYMRPYHD